MSELDHRDEPTRYSRRRMVAGGGLLLANAAVPACAASGPRSIRRIVTSESHNGVNGVVFRDAALPQVTLNGSTITRLWETDGVPTYVPIEADSAQSAGNAYREGFTGTSLYIADIPSGPEVPKIPMHREDSLDYIAVLSGEIHLVLENEELLMRAGDVLVQGGNLHTWENRSGQPCRLLVVVLRAQRRVGAAAKAI